MERNESRSFSFPPDFLSSSSPLCPAANPDIASGDEAAWLPTSTRTVEDNTPSSRIPSTRSRSFSSPAPNPNSGELPPSSSLFAYFSSTTASTFRRPSDGISKLSTAFCSPSGSYSPSAVWSRASCKVSEEVSGHSATFALDAIRHLPSQCVRPSPAQRDQRVSSRGNKTSRICSARTAQYFSADEDVEFNLGYQKLSWTGPSFPHLNRHPLQHGYPCAVNAGGRDSANLTVSHFVENMLPTLVAHSDSPARGSRATHAEGKSETASIAGERGLLASAAVPLCMRGAGEQQRRTANWQTLNERGEKQLRQQREGEQRQQRKGEQEQQSTTVDHCQQREKPHTQQYLREEQKQHCQKESDPPQQWEDQTHPLSRFPDGLRQRLQLRQELWRTGEPQQFQDGPVQQFYHHDIVSGLTRKLSAAKEHPLTTSFPPERSVQIQLLQERLRMFRKDSSNHTPPQRTEDSTTTHFSSLRPLSGEKLSGVEDFFHKNRYMHPRVSCTATFFSTATSSRQAHLDRLVVAEREDSVRDQSSHTRIMHKHELKRQEETQKGIKDTKRKEKTLWDWRSLLIWLVFICDIVIVGSTCVLHALNPASLIDKVLLTHVSFSASLCALSGGTLPGIAECLASAASGNAAAAAASTLAAANTTEWERQLLSREEEEEQVELPLLQLLRDPYSLPHYKRYLPHPLKRELGLSCVCGWAALAVLGMLTLWMTARDRSLAMRVLSPATDSDSKSVCSVNGKEDSGVAAPDNKSVFDSSRERDEACRSPCSVNSRLSSWCSSPIRKKDNSASGCDRNHITDRFFCGIAGYSNSCEASGTISSVTTKSFTIAGACRNDSRQRLPIGVSKRGSRSVDIHAHGCGGREPENRNRRHRAAAGVEVVKGREYDSNQSYRREGERAYVAEMKGRLREYDEIVLKEYQAGAVIYTRARMRCVSLFVFFVFFGMNFIVQLYVRCHRTKYKFYTLQSLAAAAVDEEAHLAGAAGAFESSNIQAGNVTRDLPTTPNTLLPPLNLLLHAHQPAAAFSAHHFDEGDAEEKSWLLHQPRGNESGGALAGLQVEYQRQDYKQKPPTSPSYVYYRDYLFWYQLYADFCRELEMHLSLGWIGLHILAVALCRSIMREAEVRVNAAHDTFQRQCRHVSKARYSL